MVRGCKRRKMSEQWDRGWSAVKSTKYYYSSSTGAWILKGGGPFERRRKPPMYMKRVLRREGEEAAHASHMCLLSSSRSTIVKWQ
eukprot:scaffold54322_cov45-Tisochrysis_lutea.AAC.1